MLCGLCRFNATSGRFELNFTQDCIYLLVSPAAHSRVILHCENVHLSNCSVNRDTLTVNLKGDLRFGRNSYLYCGSNVHVRTTSLRRRISIRVRQDLNVRAVTECNFFARKERNYNDEAGGSHGIGECGRHGRNSKVKLCLFIYHSLYHDPKRQLASLRSISIIFHFKRDSATRKKEMRPLAWTRLNWHIFLGTGRTVVGQSGNQRRPRVVHTLPNSRCPCLRVCSCITGM